MMSGRRNGDDVETLFSLELLVENIRVVEKESQVSDELAVGLRLLDFPTLLIHQPQRGGGDVSRRPPRGEKHTFNRGKCCFFKTNLNKLHADLSSAPLYVMVLDVKEELPKLVGTSLVSLATAMDGIRRDAAEHGVSAASSHGERGLVGVRDLNGETIRSISLSYKLKSLGASLPPQSNRTTTEPPDCGPDEIQHQPSNENTSMPDEEHSLQGEHKPGSQILEEDLTVFCPPHLFYNNSAEEKSTNEGCNFLNLDSEAFPFEDTHSEEDASPPAVDQRVGKPARTQETSGVTPNDLGEALRQLPLLNALLVELSQLSGQNPQRPLSVHPNLSWIYRPASTEPAAGRSKSLQKTSPKHLLTPRHCSTPAVGPASVKQDLIQSSRSPRKKLVYGTTRTFNLRLKQLPPVEQKRRECIDLIQSATQSSVAKAKTKSKPGKRKPALNRSCGLNENVKTMMQSMQGTATLKQKTQQVHSKPEGSPRTSEKPSLLDSRCVHIPGVVGDDVAPDEDEKLRGESSGVTSGAESLSRRDISNSPDGSPESRFSDSSEPDYADDFNSLEASEAFTPDPASSPESSRAKTPRSPLRPDFQKRAVLPVPVKAPGSPQRALRVAVRPRTHASALSSSSSDEGSASLRTVLSGKPITTGSGRVERSSGAESLVSPRGQRSTEESGPGFSTESVSFEPQEADEVEDELGSLDLKKEYRHISELVANKLPGYTM